MLPLVLPLCHPLGAGSSAGDVPINPTVRGKEGGNFTFPCSRFTLTLNAFEVLFFKKKKYIYIFRFGGEEMFFLFGFDKMGCGEFLNAVPLACPTWDSYLRGGCPIRLGAAPPTPGTSLPSGSFPFSMRN